MTLLYVEAPASVSETVQCPYCSCMYPVAEGDEPRSLCKRCGASMHVEDLSEFADLQARGEAEKLGTSAVQTLNRAVRSLVDVGYTEAGAKALITKKKAEQAGEG